MRRTLSIFAAIGLMAAAMVATAGFPFASANRVQVGPPVTNEVLDLTNAQKLSLPANTAVGTRVAVSDGFVASGSGEAEVNGVAFTFRGVIAPHSDPVYQPSEVTTDLENSTGGAVARQRYNPGDHPIWAWINRNGDLLYFADDTSDNPWELTWETGDAAIEYFGYPAVGALPVPTLTHPAIQQLAAPDSDVEGVVLMGAGTAFANRPYYETGTNDGKPRYLAFGFVDESGVGYDDVYWDAGASAWKITDDGTFGLLYQSTDAVAFPWLVTTWTAVNGALPVPTTRSATGGEFDAGFTMSGAGTAAANGVYWGYGQYYKIETGTSTQVYIDATQWTQINIDVSYLYKSTGTLFPWEETWVVWGAGVSVNPPPTVTRNNVASERNWEVVP